VSRIDVEPTVTVVIPVFNGSNFLASAIDSVLAQTYPDIEIIVVNDGSDDAGQVDAVAATYGDKIRYVHKPNGGVASALNTGILLATGEYISWLSHDDMYTPDKIESQVREVRRIGDKRTVLYSDYVNVDGDDNELYPVRMDHDLLTRKPMYAVFRGALHGCTLLIPRAVFTEVGLFRDLPTTQDYDMWFRMIRCFDFRHSPEIYVRSRLHPAQTSRQTAVGQEANQLWINMMDSLTDSEILRMESDRKPGSMRCCKQKQSVKDLVFLHCLK
jgi:glycosyltransferase involved in cell wall biosynthesis